MKFRIIASLLSSAAALTLAVGTPASASTTSASAVPTEQTAVMLVAAPASLSGPVTPNAIADNWPVEGAPCKGNPYSWCDMNGHSIVGNPLAPLDEYNVRFKFDPHWQSVDIIWTVTTHNSHAYLSNFRVTVHVLCLSNRDCKDQEHALGGKGSGRFKVQYPENLKGRLVIFGMELQTNCSRCAPGSKHPDAKARTREAKCQKTKDRCKFV
jgi:hypothetical protein